MERDLRARFPHPAAKETRPEVAFHLRFQNSLSRNTKGRVSLPVSPSSSSTEVMLSAQGRSAPAVRKLIHRATA
jgi:hypothetical protein